MSKDYKPNKRKPVCRRKASRYSNSLEDYSLSEEYTADKLAREDDWGTNPELKLPRKLEIEICLTKRCHGTLNKTKEFFIKDLTELKNYLSAYGIDLTFNPKDINPKN